MKKWDPPKRHGSQLPQTFRGFSSNYTYSVLGKLWINLISMKCNLIHLWTHPPAPSDLVEVTSALEYNYIFLRLMFWGKMHNQLLTFQTSLIDSSRSESLLQRAYHGVSADAASCHVQKKKSSLSPIKCNICAKRKICFM